MTATTVEAPGNPAPQAPKSTNPNDKWAGSKMVGILWGISGLASWIGGVALHSGYHVNVPFLASWLILFFGHLTVAQITGVVANVWHSHKLGSASQLAALERSGELWAEEFARQNLPAAVAQDAGIR